MFYIYNKLNRAVGFTAFATKETAQRSADMMNAQTVGMDIYTVVEILDDNA